MTERVHTHLLVLLAELCRAQILSCTQYALLVFGVSSNQAAGTDARLPSSRRISDQHKVVWPRPTFTRMPLQSLRYSTSVSLKHAKATRTLFSRCLNLKQQLPFTRSCTEDVASGVRLSFRRCVLRIFANSAASSPSAGNFVPFDQSLVIQTVFCFGSFQIEHEHPRNPSESGKAS